MDAAAKALACTLTVTLVAGCGGDTGRDTGTSAGGPTATVTGGTSSGGAATGGASSGGTGAGGLFLGTGGAPTDPCPRDCSYAPALGAHACPQCTEFSAPVESCQLPLPAGEEITGVALDCVAVAPDQIQLENDQVTLLGEACDRIRSDPPPRVDVLIGCMMDA